MRQLGRTRLERSLQTHIKSVHKGYDFPVAILRYIIKTYSTYPIPYSSISGSDQHIAGGNLMDQTQTVPRAENRELQFSAPGSRAIRGSRKYGARIKMRRGEMLMAKSFLFPDQLANLHHFVVICYEYCSINQIMKKGSYFKCRED